MDKMWWHRGSELFPILCVRVIVPLHKQFRKNDMVEDPSGMIDVTYNDCVVVIIKMFSPNSW